MRKQLILFCIVLLAVSCNPCKKISRLAYKCPDFKQVDSVYVYENTETTIEDLFTYTEPDSSVWDLYFKCDSDFQVLLMEFDHVNSGIETEIKYVPQIRYIEDGSKISLMKFSLSVYVDSLAMRDRTIATLKTRLESKSSVIQLPPEKFIPRWVKILALIGVIFILYIIYRLYKFFKPRLPFR